MAAAIGVRGDYDAARLRELAKRSADANQTRRLLALAAIYDGGSRTEAAKIGGGGGHRVGAAGPCDRQAAGQRAAPHPGAPAGVAGDRRERSDPGGSRRGALAPD